MVCSVVAGGFGGSSGGFVFSPGCGGGTCSVLGGSGFAGSCFAGGGGAGRRWPALGCRAGSSGSGTGVGVSVSGDSTTRGGGGGISSGGGSGVFLAWSLAHADKASSQ